METSTDTDLSLQTLHISDRSLTGVDVVRSIVKAASLGSDLVLTPARPLGHECQLAVVQLPTWCLSRVVLDRHVASGAPPDDHLDMSLESWANVIRPGLVDNLTFRPAPNHLDLIGTDISVNFTTEHASRMGELDFVVDQDHDRSLVFSTHVRGHLWTGDAEPVASDVFDLLVSGFINTDELLKKRTAIEKSEKASARSESPDSEDEIFWLVEPEETEDAETLPSGIVPAPPPFYNQNEKSSDDLTDFESASREEQGSDEDDRGETASSASEPDEGDEFNELDDGERSDDSDHDSIDRNAETGSPYSNTSAAMQQDSDMSMADGEDRESATADGAPQAGVGSTQKAANELTERQLEFHQETGEIMAQEITSESGETDEEDVADHWYPGMAMHENVLDFHH